MFGWVPKEEFRGDPSKWIPADEFLQKAEENMPLMRSNLQRLEEKLRKQSERIKEQEVSIKMLKRLTEQALEKAKRTEEQAYQRALEELKKQQRQAFEAHDEEAFEEASRKIDDFIKNHPLVSGKKEPELEPEPERTSSTWTFDPAVFEEWKSENPWFEEDPDLFFEAVKIDQWLTAKGKRFGSHREYLEHLTNEVKRRKPEKFGKRSPELPSVVEMGSGRAGPSYNREYAELPPEAKAACDRWVEEGLLTREAYLDLYHGRRLDFEALGGGRERKN